MFIPVNFKIPENLSNEQFHFEILEPSLNELDYEAVMSSQDRLRNVFAENDDWPASDMSIEFNKNDLIMHENEFKAREAFAYSVFNPTKDNYIGCVYINPTEYANHDCEVYICPIALSPNRMFAWRPIALLHYLWARWDHDGLRQSIHLRNWRVA